MPKFIAMQILAFGALFPLWVWIGVQIHQEIDPPFDRAMFSLPAAFTLAALGFLACLWVLLEIFRIVPNRRPDCRER